MNKTCCNTPVRTGKKNNEFCIWCESCGKKGKGKTESEAWKAFEKSNPSTLPMKLPKNPGQLPVYIEQNMNELISMASLVVKSMPRMKEIIKDNMKYVQRSNHLAEVWKTEEGQKSIVEGYEKSIAMACPLGIAGDLVPFDGKHATFDPDVEAIIFFLTTGDSSPFEWVNIEAIHENDIVNPGRKNGNFYLDFESFGNPRGEVVQVAAYGLTRNGMILGDIRDTPDLMKIAEDHSPSYRSYIQDVRSFEIMRQEGKTKKQNGREYFEKLIEYRDKKTGDMKSFSKKIFIDDLTNPYENSSREKMLCKLMGKSWMNQFRKIRNSRAAVNEMVNGDQAHTAEEKMDAAFAGAFEALKIDPEIDNTENDIETEIEIMDDEPEVEPDNNPPKQSELNIH